MSQMNTVHGTMSEPRDKHHPQPINIIVEVNGKNRHIQFESSRVTGRQIREKAGVPLTDDLTQLVHGKPTGGNIGLDDIVEIHNGDHFIALPTGVVS